MTRRRGRRRAPIAALIAVASLLAVSAAPAGASTIQLEDVRLAGPASPWRPTNSFTLTWKLPPTVNSHIVANGPYTVDYLIRSSSSNAVSPLTRFTTEAAQLPGVEIPVPAGLAAVPRGLYTIELWAEGSTKPHAFQALGFDDEPPPPARPIAPSEWLRAGSSAEVEIEHPSPLPISGIRGYALLLDHSSAGAPCAGPDRCAEAETDLDGGIEDDAVRVGPLLEETNVVRVVAVSNSGLRSRLLESAPLHVDGTPPQIGFSGLPAGWSNQPVRVTATATDPLSGVAAAGPEGPLVTLAVDAGAPTVVLGSQAAASVDGDGPHRLLATARDAVGNATDAAHPATAVVRIDETPPRVSFAVGRDPAEPERIDAAVGDALSGPAAEGTIALRPAGSSQRFQPLPTSGSPGHLTALWDSDSYPPGEYEFRVTGHDLAGNETSSELRADGSRLVLPSPLKTAAALSFGFGGRQLVLHRCRRRGDGLRCRREVIADFDRRPARRTVPFGHTIPVSGRLTSSSGAALAGLEVEIGETFATGSTPLRRTTTVVTGSDGGFLAHLAPGPSRRIAVDFAGTRQLTRSSGRALALGVRGRVRFGASSSSATIGGAPVRFTGRVDHEDVAIPAAGLAVELQFQVLGSPWSEFRTVQTDAFGRFGYPYSFSDDDSRGVRFQFRAVVPEQAGWPYETGASRPVAVTGR
ncbi:MAG: hypothetical protein ACOYD4_16160 [Solirubrobacterales bacterium]